MLNFLRKLRRNEMKGTRYLKYAIGEIFLVIVGILIALALAEWNDARHEREREAKQLLQVREGLQKDLTTLDSLYAIIEKTTAQVYLLDSLLKSPRTQPDSYYDTLFGQVYGIRGTDLNSAYYESLKTSGFDLIKSDRLKAQLIQTFELDYHLLEEINEGEIGINTDVNRPYYLPNFHNIVFFKSAIPNDINKVWKDRYYHNLVNYRLTNLQVNQGKMYQVTLNDIQKLIGLIDDYLK